MDIAEIARAILKDNPAASLSGSIALKLQGVSLRREPKDIDIYLPYGVKLADTLGLVFLEDYQDGSGDEPEFDRISYRYTAKDEKLFDIDIFNPSQKRDDIVCERVYVDGLKLLPKEEIIKFKIMYAFDSSFSKWKHKDDIAHMMANIT